MGLFYFYFNFCFVVKLDHIFVCSDTLPSMLASRSSLQQDPDASSDPTIHRVTDIAVGMRVRVSTKAKGIAIEQIRNLNNELLPWLPAMDMVSTGSDFN